MATKTLALGLDDGFLVGYRDGTLARDRAIGATAPLPTADEATTTWADWLALRGQTPPKIARLGYQRGYQLGREACDKHTFHGGGGIPSPGEALDAWKRRTRLTARHLLVVEQALPDRGLCGNGRLSKYARTAAVARAREAGYYAARRALEALPQELRGFVPYFPSGVRVGLTAKVIRDPLWAHHPLDDGNFWAGCKAYQDGWADAGVVANDNQFFYDGAIVWVPGEPCRGNLIVTMTPEKGA